MTKTTENPTQTNSTETDRIEKQKPLSLVISGMALCAALYAVGSYLTAYIPSPWGVGQFRPAVVVPALFSVVFGPIPAGVGAALGTLIADSAKYGYLYPGSYLAAVPGNFIGFYIFGLIVKKFSWRRFVSASYVTLLLANFIVAALYVTVFKIMYVADPRYVVLSSEALQTMIIGLTMFWFITMLPFVLLVTPPLIRIVAQATPSLIPEDVRRHGIAEELPHNLLSNALLGPGLAMLAIVAAVTLTPLGTAMTGYRGAPPLVLLQWMFGLSGIGLAGVGVVLRRGTFSIKPLPAT